MVLREHNDPLNQSRGIMGPLENATGVQNNRGRLRQRFDFIRKLGQGTYGKVQLGIDKETGQEVAIKTIKKSKIETEADLIRIRREIQIMSSVRHPNIIHIYEVFENREKMVLVMEYAAGGELYDYLNERKILEEDEARRIFRQIASAVYYCHKHKICHRDLKLENILLDEKFNAKIADFGLSNVFSDATLLKTFCGSPLYASPEIVRGTPYKGPEVDCWSLGVLLYTLVYGAMPFDGSNFKRLVKQISNGDYFEPKKPAEASPLIRTMLTVDPKRRADIGGVCAHHWINQGFDKDCLAGADELATQTPVRLDLLLALANCSAINQNQIVIDQQQGAPPPEVGPSKTKAPEDDKKQPPTKPKRSKMQSKSKSKSSPLLEMIHDEEEMPVPDDIGDCQGGAAGGAGAAGGEDDDNCDTLSEISEIQTLAEEMEGDNNAEQGGIHSATTSDVMPKTKVKKEKMRQREKSQVRGAAAPVQEPQVKVEAAVAPAAAEPKPKLAPKPVLEQEKSPEPPKVVKKKVLKPKTTAAPPQVEEKKAEVETPATVPPKPAETEKVPPEVEPPAPTSQSQLVKEKSSTPGEDSGSDSASKPKNRLKDRADSVSPTRIERRNSKVISQKTAELIQNLETKVSPSGAASTSSTTSVAEPPPKPPGIKKLVIPSFKVSDAKSKFESKPPRPLITSVSRSKAAFEAKALQSQTSVEEKKPLETSGSRSSISAEKEQKPAEVPPQKTEAVAAPPPAEVKKTAPPPEPQTQTPPKQEVPVVPEPKKTEDAAKTIETAAEVKQPSPEPEAVPQPPPVIKTGPVRGPGKIQIPAALAAKVPAIIPAVTEVKPVLLDSGKGGPRPAMMITKGKTTHLPDIRNLSSPTPPKSQPPSHPHPVSQKHAVIGDKCAPASVSISASTTLPPQVAPSKSTTACNENATCAPPESSDTEAETGKIGATPPLGPAAAAKQKLLSKLPPPQNKEQAAKKITSVITKLVSSGSVDKGLNEEGSSKTLPRAVKKEPEKIIKTEVCFPVQAASTQERIIPIQLVQEEASASSPAESTVATPTPQPLESQQMMPGLPQRQQSSTSAFSRMNSTASQFSRQNSSNTESLSLAPPTKLEPLKKCPREFLIPIKLEGSGQTVTPKEDLTSSTVDASHDAGEDDFRMDSRLRSGRFGRQKRYSGLLSDASFDDESSVASGVSAASSRRPSGTPGLPPTAAHTRSRSQGDEPAPPGGGTFKRYRARRHATAAPDMPLGRSDSFSSAEEDEEDAFQVLTAESLFTNLLDRVRNLTRRINRDDPLMSPNWSTDPTTFGLWGNSPLRELMGRAPSETRSVASSLSGHHKAFSREPSVTTVAGGPGGAWRRSLSRDLSGDSDSAGHSASINNVQSRSQLSSRLSNDLFETSSARSLPLTTRRSQATSYLSQRSVDGDVGANIGSNYLHNHGLHHTLGSSPRSSIYSRSLSHGTAGLSGPGGVANNSDYGTGSSPSQISRTLPLRRSLKTFDRSPQNVLPEHDTVPSTSSASTRLSLLDSKYEPSSYLTRLRSMSRERERDSSVSRFNSTTSSANNRWDSMNGFDSLHHYQPSSLTMSSISPASTGISLDSTTDSIVSPTSSFSYGGGRDIDTASNNSSGGLSVQEKMNNYSQYYQSLSQSPFRRLPLASPSQIHSQNGSSTPTTPVNGSLPPPIPPHSASFGVGLSELSKNSQSRPLSFTEIPTNTPLTLATGNITGVSSATSPSSNTLSPSTLSTVSSPPTSPNEAPPPIIKPAPPISTLPPASQTSPKGNEEKPPTGPSTSSIPRWPTVSVRQHRPLSISSFPNGPRASSVSRVLSPPPQDKEQAGNSTTSSSTSTTQKRREGRATSVERITKLLERKSVPREIPPQMEEQIAIVHEPKIAPPPAPPQVEPLANGTAPTSNDKPSGLKKPKFLQSLEKKWEKLTHHGTSSPPPPPIKQEEIKPVEPPRGEAVASPEPPHTTSTSEENSSHEEKINESVLLRRALSPEKKVKTNRLGGGTVGFMLGRFKKFEGNEVGSVVNASSSKIPTGRPPLGGAALGGGTTTTQPPPSTLVSRFRRVQSAYGGATSDSCLTLTPKETGRSGDTEESGIIRSAALMAKEKRRPRVEIQRDIPTVKSPDKNQAEIAPKVEEKVIEPTPQAPILVSEVVTHQTDLISRAVTCSPLPDIMIDTTPELDIKPDGEIVGAKSDLTLLTPVSIAESDATSGGSVEEEIVSITSQMKPEEDEESVSDRILRKSFYNRFNSVERRKSNSVTSASIARANAEASNSKAGSSSSTTTSIQRRGSSSSRLSVGSGSNRSSLKERPPSVNRRSISPAPSTVASYESKDSSDSQNRSPSPYYLSGLNKYNPNPLFKELITTDLTSTSGGEYRSAEVGKKTEYSRRITSKLSKLLREIESDLNSCQLAKTGSEISVDGDTAALLLGTGDGNGIGSSNTRHSLPSPVIMSKPDGNNKGVKAKNDGDHEHATKK